MPKANRVYITNTISNNPVLRKLVLESYPNAKFTEKARLTDQDDLIEFMRDCDSAVVAFEPMTERVLSALPNLKIVSKFGAGYEKIDFEAVQRHNVYFGYEIGVNRLAVAELAISLMIASLRWIPQLNAAMRAGERPMYKNGRLLTGRIVGIHGCGNIGKEIVRLLKPFNCTILACDIVDYANFYKDNGITPVSFETLIETSEILTLHLPKTKLTKGLYSRAVLEKLRPDCVLINTCRGGIVDEDVVLERLEQDKLIAAAFDVFDVEPAQNDRLINHRNFLCTPHIGASTHETRIAMVQAALRGLTKNGLVRPGQYYE